MSGLETAAYFLAGADDGDLPLIAGICDGGAEVADGRNVASVHLFDQVARSQTCVHGKASTNLNDHHAPAGEGIDTKVFGHGRRQIDHRGPIERVATVDELLIPRRSGRRRLCAKGKREGLAAA